MVVGVVMCGVIACDVVMCVVVCEDVGVIV